MMSIIISFLAGCLFGGIFTILINKLNLEINQDKERDELLSRIRINEEKKKRKRDKANDAIIKKVNKHYDKGGKHD